MIIYKNTFNNKKTLNCNFPVEDQYYAKDNIAIVVDGITRDPIGIFDLNSVTLEEFNDKYPRPSGAEIVAKSIVNSFKNNSGNLKERLIECNKEVKKINDKYIKKCDYLQNDYYGAVAATALIQDENLYYSYICDCGIIVYDKDGNIKFQTEDEKEKYSDPYINIIIKKIPWNLPEARIIVRRDYRNNLNNVIDGKCVSYGALTGEKTAISFIRKGKIKLNINDIIIVYSDGFSPLLHRKDFINQILNFDKLNFEKYIGEISERNPDKYGKEKTLVIMK